MCMTLTKDRILPKIAESDMTVLKIISIADINSNTFSSEIQRYRYIRNVPTPHIEVKVEPFICDCNLCRGLYGISEGYHSYSLKQTSVELAKDENKRRLWTSYVYCTIPKGTKYWENAHGNIVSETITITGVVT
uniref:Uncharacterized protein n=1 Tax=viral metagenome TaxID=1070528 RepID=A0A6M3LHQ0_9ZZZZ